MTISLRETMFFPYQELESYEKQMEAGIPSRGAAAVFVGTMRDVNLGDVVAHMVLEYYPGMTECQLDQIVRVAQARWELIDVLVVHRIGQIYPGDPIVLVAVWAAHRGDAFDSCRYIVEELKHRAPFWKKEALENGARWLEGNTDGYGKEALGAQSMNLGSLEKQTPK